MVLIRVLSSLRFAVSMFVLAAVLSGAATFFNWPGFFNSPYFLAPAGLFSLSLLTCTINSLVTRPIRPLTGYAHDVIHIGVLVLLMGGLLTLLAAREEQVFLDVGESMKVREEWEVELISSERTPENWESLLEIRKEGELVGRERLAVNDPVKIGPVRLLQQSWEEARVLILEDDAGRQYTMSPGEGFAAGETVIVLEEAPQAEIGLQFARFDESKRQGTISIEEGMSVAELGVIGSEQRVRNGIQVVHDPGAPVALVGALVLIAGLILYVIRKVREERF
ncbi:MAG: cytochrome c biogenesis protein ResB [Spirochaetaceae bacterium]